MGCATSRLEASDVVMQCKERRKLIKNAVNCRQDFAIAHVAYIQTLRNVGLALRRFSEGEVSDTSPRTPSTPVLPLTEASPSSPPAAALSPPPPTIFPSSPSPRPSPPASSPSAMVAAAIPKAASPPSPPLPVSMSPRKSSHASPFSHSSPPPPPPPLAQDAGSPTDTMDVPPLYSVNGMISPDRASDFSPPYYSPRRDDADDYFMAFSQSPNGMRTPPPMPSPTRNSSLWSMFDIFEPPPIPYNLREQRRRKHGGEVEEEEEDEEVQDFDQVRKEEGIPDLEEEEIKEDGEVHSGQDLGKGKGVEKNASVLVQEKRVVYDDKAVDVPETRAEIPVEKANGEVEQTAAIPGAEKEVVAELEPKESPKKELSVLTTVKERDLTGAVRHIHNHFARACRSGKDVSSMLETRMVYHHLGFLDLKDSSKVFNAITSHWSRKTSLAMRDAYEDTDIAECGMHGSHASTLERLYAWEKKLYDEVKAGELIRLAFDRKCQQLHSLDAKGGDPTAIDKTRAAVKKLDTRLMVALQAIHSASMRVQLLTNEELYPQLAELLGGLMSMWKVMWECHQAQQAIASEMQTLENSVAGDEASEAHIKATIELEHELKKWRTHFQRWFNSQKNYIDTLHAWLLKCHMELEGDKKGRPVSPHWTENPAIFVFLSNWRKSLERLEKQEGVVDAISKFASVVHSLEMEQSGELDLKKNAERSARDLDKSTNTLKRLERKYLEYKEESDGGREVGSSKSTSVQLKKADLDTQRNLVESEKQRHTEVMLDRKEKTLSHFKEHLPLVFESMASFAKDALKVYEELRPDGSPVRENGEAHTISED